MAEIEVTVQSFLPYYEPQGEFQLLVSPEITVEELLIELCKKAGIPLKPEYILRNKSHATLYRTDTLTLSKVANGEFLQWASEASEKRNPRKCNIFHFLAGASFLIGISGIVAVSVIRFRDNSNEQDYAVVFDAGSSHSSMFIYKWEASRMNGTAVATQFGEICEVNGDGISSYIEEPQKAGQSLQSCINQAAAAIPSHKHSNTPIYLGATAGMRLLSVLNKTVSDAILDSVRAIFVSSPFKVQDPGTNVRILSGKEEGAFSWITTNYITNAFKVNQPGKEDIAPYTIVPTLGAMDLGGASTQITFVPENGTVMPPDYREELLLFGQNYTVYTHSYLCYGVNEVSRQIYASLVLDNPTDAEIDHPCLPPDFIITLPYEEIFDSACVKTKPSTKASNYTFVGAGASAGCLSSIKKTLFDNSSCHYNRCSFNNTYEPEVTGPFYAFSSFYYVANFLNLLNGTANINREDFEQSASVFCEINWDEMKNMSVPKKIKKNLMYYCLQSNYISTLLTTGYGFPDHLWHGISFVSQIFGTAIGWTLGYVLKESNGYPTAFPQPTISTLTFSLLLALFCMLLIMSFILAIELRKAHNAWREQQPTTSRYEAI